MSTNELFNESQADPDQAFISPGFLKDELMDWDLAEWAELDKKFNELFKE